MSQIISQIQIVKFAFYLKDLIYNPDMIYV